MIIRDIDVLQDAARRAKVGVSLSVPTLDDAIHRVTEPGTAPPRQRLRAVRMLADAGIRVAVAMAPIIPGVSDRPDLLRDAVRAARDAGAVRIWTELLYLRPGTREHFLETLAAVWPAEAERLARLYAQRAHRPTAEVHASRDSVLALVARHRAPRERARADRARAAATGDAARAGVRRGARAGSRLMLRSVNPSDGRLLAEYPPHDAATSRARLDACAETFRSWSRTPVETRATVLRRAASLLRERRDTLARLATLEMGKTIVAAEAEVEKCAWVCEHYASEAATLLAPEDRADRGTHVVRAP
jgi:hypothetical protein